MLTKEELPECPVATTVQLIGNKWKLLILRNLIYNGTQRFGDFIKTLPAISKRVLTDNLRSLEDDGLIEREYLPKFLRAWNILFPNSVNL